MYIEYNYLFDLAELKDYLKCPKCGNNLVMREGRYGKFIGCTGYPECKFIYEYKKENQEKLNCPICNKESDVKTGNYGTFLGCSSYPDCDTLEQLKKNTILITFTIFELLIPKQ